MNIYKYLRFGRKSYQACESKIRSALNGIKRTTAMHCISSAAEAHRQSRIINSSLADDFNAA
ncbi:hypothetical protein [Uliginosibacterium sediminicola]|uniref:hypothetical protein n=1 Tax=Uliginosibacterium sediminicola TaxID=2024550 RepID=UPI0031F6899C